MRSLKHRIKALNFILKNLIDSIDDEEEKDEDYKEFLRYTFVCIYDVREDLMNKDTIKFKLSSLLLALVVLVTGAVISNYIPDGYGYMLGFFVSWIYFNITRRLD